MSGLIAGPSSDVLPHHHRDPFDRMLVAQAVVEGLVLVTGDERLSSYDMPVLWQLTSTGEPPLIVW